MAKSGSGRVKHFTPYQNSGQRGVVGLDYGVGRAELTKKIDELLTPITDVSGADSMSRNVSKVRLDRSINSVEEYLSYIKRYQDADESDDNDVLFASDEFSYQNDLLPAAFTRESIVRCYFTFPMNNVRPDALTRLMKNTKCLEMDEPEGMTHMYGLGMGENKVIIVADYYTQKIHLMTFGLTPGYDTCEDTVIKYLADAGVLKDYTIAAGFLTRDEADMDPLANTSPLYPAVWITGAYPEEIQLIKRLGAWYGGMLKVYITPASPGTNGRVLRIKNVFGRTDVISINADQVKSDDLILVAKTIFDADRHYREISELGYSASSRMIDPGNVPADGMDITKIPLFKIPEKLGEDFIEDIFTMDADKAMEIIKNGQLKADGKDNTEELEKLKKDIEKANKTVAGRDRSIKEFEEKFKNLQAANDAIKKECEDKLASFKERIEKSETKKKELEDKVAEYAGLLRDQKDTDEYEQILKTAEEENAALKKRCAELEAANEALKSNFEVIKRKDVKGEALICRGSEKDYFVGEIKDFILSAVAKELDVCQPETRRAHVLKDILDSNGYERLLEGKRSRLKAICRDYDGCLSRALPELEKEGYCLKTINGHPKVEYYGDSRYVSVVSMTPSDYAAGLNQISDMARMCF